MFTITNILLGVVLVVDVILHVRYRRRKMEWNGIVIRNPQLAGDDVFLAAIVNAVHEHYRREYLRVARPPE